MDKIQLNSVDWVSGRDIRPWKNLLQLCVTQPELDELFTRGWLLNNNMCVTIVR